MHLQKSKILMIIGLFSPYVGGAERECQKISKRLKSMGYEVFVLTSYQESLPPYETIDDIPVYRKLRGWHFFEVTYMLSVFFFLFRHRKDFDIIFCFGLYLYIGPAVLFSLLAKKKIFFRRESATEAGDFFRISKLRWGNFIFKCSKWADGVIAISQEIELELLNHGFSSKIIYRIPNSVDIKRFFPGPGFKKDDTPVISYIGRLDEGKGLETFIQALKIIKGRLRNLKVFIVGEGELKAHLIETVKHFGLEDWVNFTGEVTDVVPYYHQSQILVQPSFSEGMPLVLLEAMACGVAVVASKVGGMIDIMGAPRKNEPEQGGYWLYENGILFSPGDEDALVEAMFKLINDHQLRGKLSKNALENIQSNYSLEKIVQHYLNLFN